MKKTLRKLVIDISIVFLAVIVILMESNIITAQADTASKPVLDAKNGVIEVNVNYVDNSSKSYLIQGGSGFLIGKGGSSGAQYVITNYHVVNLDDDTIDAAKTFFSTTELNTRVEVVVKGDVTVTAQIVKSSKDSDWAILKLDETIYDRSTLKLKKTDSVAQTQDVYALGFPSVLTYLADTSYYTSSDVTITTGQVSKLTTINSFNYIQHSAALSSGNSGGPLVDSTGSVIGLNTSGAESTYFFSLQIDEIIKILDAFGIPYELAGGSLESVPSQTGMAQTQTQTQTQATQATTVEPTQVQPVIQDKNSDISSTMSSTTIIIIVAVAVLVIAILVIVLVVVKKKTGERPPVTSPPFGTNGSFVPPMPPTSPRTPASPLDSGAGETSVLDNGAGETSVLNNSGQQSATLVRVKTGETINIKKQKFLLGKERNRVDYCITNNNSISRTHANIICRNGMYYVVDLNSTNSTYLNGKQLAPNQETKLNVNDKIKLADEEFIFRM